jgi:hypothetical protein
MGWLLIHLNDVYLNWIVDIIEMTVGIIQLGMEG